MSIRPRRAYDPHMSRTLSALARAVALAALLSFVAAGPASAVSKTTYEKQVVTATNEFRAQQGKVAVKLQKCVDRWANGQAAWMARTGKFEHRKGRLAKVMKSCKLTGASENIGWNYATGTAVVTAWSGSRRHAANMGASKMRYIGVGVARSKSGKIFVAQVFGTRR